MLSLALVICIFGGLRKAFLGVVGRRLVSQPMGITMAVIVISVAASFALASTTGIFFGYYAARKTCASEMW